MSRAAFPIVVHVLLRRRLPEQQIFLLRRANTGFLDGAFAPPGGHVRSGELPLNAAIRECVEEAGCTPLNLQPLCVMPYRAGISGGVNFVFETDDFSGVAGIAEPESADVGVWAPLAVLPEPCAPWLHRALQLPGTSQWYVEFDG